ncbi:peptide chain release factor N(5)-glutamine methyltransferase [Neptunomonas antarctica]|uniref:Release factor glutamine methyltransferase n=1 Tax=Neptunomonas antarctica TaxID=619304 RepID=A0A1N7N4Y0_9GAMM|nr:peptide chain release factor N(5)-glutamine methyltransferase [Neptunomonas antarctica]SIS93437.1 [protein release factor]-glutamine N5-methyltransferase [Neptunomonas antarctica]
MRIAEVLKLAQRLEDVSDSPRLDTELFLCHVLEKPSSYLMTWPEKELTEAKVQRFYQCLERRQRGEPVAYILGMQAFWTLDLEVSADTLIPRADTEVLVETALNLLPNIPLRVADLGTGTGAIALALASERSAWDVWGCDRIIGAVELAKRNQTRLGLAHVTFVQGSWLEPLEGRFDMIVSNPPYIDQADEHLQQGDVRFEPLSALVAGEDGLSDIRHIITASCQYLAEGGWLLFEHGYQQATAVRSLFSEEGYSDVVTYQDYAGNDRVTLGCWRNSNAD